MNGRDVVTASLRLIGALAPGEGIPAQEASDGLATLNRMLSSWSTEGLAIHAVTQESPLTLTAGDATYTMGTAGDITTRPMEIVSALIRDGSTDHTLKIISDSEYAALSSKSTRSTYPQYLYDDGGYPLRTLTLYPVPSAATQLVLYTRRPLSQITTLDTNLSLPEGYERAIVFNLALDLAPEYGRQVSDVVVSTANQAKEAMKRANHRPAYLRADTALLGRKKYDFMGGT